MFGTYIRKPIKPSSIRMCPLLNILPYLNAAPDIVIPYCTLIRYSKVLYWIRTTQGPLYDDKIRNRRCLLSNREISQKKTFERKGKAKGFLKEHCVFSKK